MKSEKDWNSTQLRSYIETKLYPEKDETFGKNVSSLEDVLDDLQKVVALKDPDFRTVLFAYIEQSPFTEVEIYKRAGLDRKLFSKIRNSSAYHPARKTVLALAIGMKCSLQQTQVLLASAGYTLSDASVQDIILRYFIERKLYDLQIINQALVEFDQPTLDSR